MGSRLGRAPLLAAAVLLAGAAVIVPALSRNVEPAYDAAQHAKRAAEEAEAAVNALTKNDTWRDTIVHALTPRWFRHEPSCDADPSACEDVSAESRSTLGKVRSSMTSLSHALGFTHDEDEDEDEDENENMGAHGTTANLLHRISSFFSGVSDSASDAASHVSGMSDELQKELGLKRKSLGDRIADALETLHIKSETPEKHAARVAADALHGASNALPDLSNLEPDVKGKWDALLKWAGIREPSALEKARAEYDHALHRMKVTLGAESLTLGERVNGRISDARDAVSGVYYTLRDSILGPHEDVEEAVTNAQHGIAGAAGAVSDTFKHAWDASVGRAADTMLAARDAASSATDEALRTLHLKPARRTRLQAARDSLDAATHRMLVALGFHEPTAAERITRYTAALAGKAQGVGRGTINAVGNAGAGVASVVGSGGNAITNAPSGLASALDTVLKALHLRERSKLEKAQETWHDAMHQLKVALKIEDPTAAEQLGIAIDNAQGRIKNLAADMAAALPGSSSAGETGITKSARKAYARTLSRAGKQYAAIRKDVDAALKAAGIKDRSLAEQIMASSSSAWHELGLALGTSEPTLGEKLHDALPIATQKRRTDSVWTKVLKAAHIKPKTAQETARDAYFDGLHKLQATLHLSQSSDPTVLGRIENAITTSRDAVGAAVDAAGDATSNTAASAAQALLSVRRELGRLLKLKGTTDQDRSALQVARDTVDESIDALWAALGYHEPSTMDRIKAGLVNALHGVGAHAAAQKAEAAIDPDGRLHGGPGVLNRMHMG